VERERTNGARLILLRAVGDPEAVLVAARVARRERAGQDPRREIRLTHRSADRPFTARDRRTNRYVGHTARQEIAREELLTRRGRGGREEIHLAGERRITEERRRARERAAEDRARDLGRARVIRCGIDVDDLAAVLQHAALEMTQPPRELGVRVILAIVRIASGRTVEAGGQDRR